MEWDPVTGKPSKDRDVASIDASDPADANWTRWANTGPTRGSNNLKSFQLFNSEYYQTIRPIRAGEELFIDYGPDYRHATLNLYYQGEKKTPTRGGSPPRSPEMPSDGSISSRSVSRSSSRSSPRSGSRSTSPRPLSPIRRPRIPRPYLMIEPETQPKKTLFDYFGLKKISHK